MKPSLFVVACASLVFLGCQKKEEPAPAMDQASYSEAMPPPPPEAPKSVMAESRPATQEGQFVRSADLRFRCKSVSQATDRIARIVAANGSYVELDELRSSISETREMPFGTDSVLELQRVDVWNTLQLRVPNDRLDTVLAGIAPLIVFLDHRIVRAQDVGRELRRAERERRRMERASARLQDLAQQGGRVRDLAQIEDQASQREGRADDALDRSEDLREQVALSAIQISIYQHREPRSDTLQRPLDETWREPFAKRIGRAFLEGWWSLQGFVLWGLSNWFWLMVAVGAAVYFLRRRSGGSST